MHIDTHAIHTSIEFGACAIAVLGWTSGFICGSQSAFLMAMWIRIKDWFE